MYQVKCADGYVRQLYSLQDVAAYINTPRVSAVVEITGPDGKDAYEVAIAFAKWARSQNNGQGS